MLILKLLPSIDNFIEFSFCTLIELSELLDFFSCSFEGSCSDQFRGTTWLVYCGVAPLLVLQIWNLFPEQITLVGMQMVLLSQLLLEDGDVLLESVDFFLAIWNERIGIEVFFAQLLAKVVSNVARVLSSTKKSSTFFSFVLLSNSGFKLTQGIIWSSVWW